MILDLRTYTCKPEKFQEWLALYSAQGYQHQVRHCGTPLIYATTESGPLNQVVHVWQYENHIDRERKRDAMMKDARFIDYMRQSREMAAHQTMESRILRPCTLFADSK
jgi:hypothetical protein